MNKSGNKSLDRLLTYEITQKPQLYLERLMVEHAGVLTLNIRNPTLEPEWANNQFSNIRGVHLG